VDDLSEVKQRLEAVTQGCETQDFVLRRNEIGQLGFHVQQDGVITEVESCGYAAKAGLKQGSRLVEVRISVNFKLRRLIIWNLAYVEELLAVGTSKACFCCFIYSFYHFWMGLDLQASCSHPDSRWNDWLFEET